MDIIFCIDNNYVMPCGITMISVLENNKDSSIRFHIIGLDLSENSQSELKSIENQYRRASVLFYQIKKEILESHEFSLYNSTHLSIAAYSRLFVVDILPENLDKAIYLDSDMIITGSLSELWNTDITNYAAAGVPDIFCMCYTDVYTALGYSSTFQYINTGLLLISLKYWREKGLKDRFIQFYNEKKNKLTFHDQDIINGTLYDSILYLPLEYNVLNCYYFLAGSEVLSQYKNKIIDAINNPIVIHYTATEKPWFKVCWHPLRNVFLKYKNLSPWENTPLRWNSEPLKKRIRFYKRSVLYASKLKKPHGYRFINNQEVFKL